MALDLDQPDPILDDQDNAEAFDEDATAGDDRLLRERATFEELPDVYDATHAVGDDDDDEAMIGEEMDDDEIIAAEQDAQDGDYEDDDLRTRDGESLRAAALDDGDEIGDDEVELRFAGDLNEVDSARLSTRDLESDELSDEDLEELDYKARSSAIDPDKMETEVDPHQDELLDEGIEETFPASDPVSVKRIT
ncbi:MAG: hypothetical protein ABIO39_07620 [Caulobacteraceae bacterium]